MNTVQNIKKVSLVFFIISGLIHLGSSIFIANSLYLKESLIVNKVADIPFIITGLIYAFSSLRIGLTNTEKPHKGLDIFLTCVIILVLIGLILINIIIPDLKS